MSLADRLKKKNADARVAGKHPLIELGADRSVRTAYFQGLSLVALVDDGVIDAKEEAYLQRLGGSLDIMPDEIAEMLSAISGLKEDESAQDEVVEEVVGAVSDSVMRKLFLAEFTCLSTVHDHDWAKVVDLRKAFADYMQCDLESAGFKLFDAIIIGLPKTASEIPTLEKSFSQPMLDYLFPGYQEQIKKEQEKKSAEAKKAEADESAKMNELEDWLVKFVEAGSQYDEKVIRAKLSWAGIKDHYQTTLLKLLLPHARRAYSVYQQKLASWGRDGCSYHESYINLNNHNESVRLLRYCCTFISLTSMDAVESIKCYMGCSRQEAVGLLDRVSGYDKPEYVFPNELGSVSLKKIVDSGMMIVWSTRAYGDEESRKNANCRLFDLILSEFEFRATW